MASDIDSPSAATGSYTASAIENEIANYRAISPLAIFSLILGVLSVLSFANWYFVALGVAAILTGIVANRNIQRFSDRLTGKGFAQLGIALGIIFSGTALTVMTVSGMVRASEAKKFALELEEVMKKGSVDDVTMYTIAPAMKKDKDPKEVLAEMKKGPKEEQMFMQHHSGLIGLMKALEGPGASVHYGFIEGTEDDGTTLAAAAVYDVHMKDAKTSKEVEERALILMNASKGDEGYEWWIQEVRFPYKLGTHVASPPPVDDGHGHGH